MRHGIRGAFAILRNLDRLAGWLDGRARDRGAHLASGVAVEVSQVVVVVVRAELCRRGEVTGCETDGDTGPETARMVAEKG